MHAFKNGEKEDWGNRKAFRLISGLRSIMKHNFVECISMQVKDKTIIRNSMDL